MNALGHAAFRARAVNFGVPQIQTIEICEGEAAELRAKIARLEAENIELLALVEKLKGDKKTETETKKAQEEAEAKVHPKMGRIIKVVAKHFGFTPLDLISQVRTKDIVFARQVAVYLCRRLTINSYPRIGKEFGNRDHTTAMHSERKVLKKLAARPELSAVLEELMAKILA